MQANKAKFLGVLHSTILIIGVNHGLGRRNDQLSAAEISSIHKACGNIARNVAIIH